VTAQLAQSPLPLVLLASLIALFGSAELGRYLGGRASRRGADTSSPTLESANAIFEHKDIPLLAITGGPMVARAAITLFRVIP